MLSCVYGAREEISLRGRSPGESNSVAEGIAEFGRHLRNAWLICETVPAPAEHREARTTRLRLNTESPSRLTSDPTPRDSNDSPPTEEPEPGTCFTLETRSRNERSFDMEVR